MKISVTPEGRPNIFLPDRESLIEWIEAQSFDQIHNFVTGQMMLGADRGPKSVCGDIRTGERLALLIGDEWKSNMKHALSIIKDNKLEIYDIGELTDDDLDVTS